MEVDCNLPGSFDPFTRGHAALVDEALNLFDRVVIGIGNNTAKTGLLTVANRKRLIDDLYAGNPRVEAHIYTGLTGEFAEKAGACAIIRGVRNTTDFEYEHDGGDQPPHLPRHHDRNASPPRPWPTYPRRPCARCFTRPFGGGVHAQRNRHKQILINRIVMMEFTAEMIAGFWRRHRRRQRAKVHTVSSIEEGKAGSLTYLTNPKYETFIYSTGASIVLVNRSFEPSQQVSATLIKVDDAACVLKLLEMYNAAKPRRSGISKLASVAEKAEWTPTATSGISR